MSGQAAAAHELKPRIIVFGVGGAGGNAVANMIAADLDGVEFVVANTDAQALVRAEERHRFQLGPGITEGLGAGARPEVGRRAAEDSLADIVNRVSQAHMVFITAGMGGGTGTGAAPVIARAARDAGALVVAVVTKPFEFEGVKRMQIAENGLKELEREVDTLIVIPNQNLFRLATEQTSIADAFAMADEVLHSGVRGVTDLMTRPGIVNLDFADVRTVMNEMGQAVMGAGEAEGPRRAADAAAAAVSNPLLDDITLKGATSVLINITGGPNLTLYDIDEAANAIRAEIDPDANIIFGSAIDETLGDRIRVSVVATGMAAGERDVVRRRPASLPEAVVEPLPLSRESKAAAAGFTFEPSERREPVAPAAADDEDGAEDEVLELTPAQMAPPLEAPEVPADAPDAPVREDASESEDATTLETPVGGVLPTDAADFTNLGEAADAAPLEVRRMNEDEERAARSGGFSIFGRRRRRESDLEEPEAPEGDASSDDEDEDLEIPAFLRRQAN